MNQRTIEKVSVSGILTSTVACLFWLAYSESWTVIVNVLQIYLILIILQIQIANVLNKVITVAPKSDDIPTPKNILDGSLLDEVNVIDVDSIEFSTSPLSFQQTQMYLMITTGEAQTRADGYVLILSFLHVRALRKDIAFRNLPINVILRLVEKAYKSAEQKKEITEFEDNNIFTDETT